MTIAEFIAKVQDKRPPAPAEALRQFESALGQPLPDDYRIFVINCNGGWLDSEVRFTGPTHSGTKTSFDIHVIGGLREEDDFSLTGHLDIDLIPSTMIWIMNDDCGGPICLGISGSHRGHVYYWDHERDEAELVANTFTDFIELLHAP